MPKFSSNISMMFREYKFLDRSEKAKSYGFDGIEIQFPYKFSINDLNTAKTNNGLEISVLNIDAGDLVDGGPGIAAIPDREDQFKRAVEQAVEYAVILQPTSMNILPGWPSMELYNRQQCLNTLANNLHYAGDALAQVGVKVLVEAVNTLERPGFLISSSSEAIEVLNLADHKNLFLQYDIYHMQIMEGNLVGRMENIIDRIGHIQFADNPGRNEPGTGEINFDFIFKRLDEMGWNGWLGAEYIPSKQTEETLQWLKPFL